MVNLDVPAAYARPSGVKAFVSQVLVPLTSPHVHMKADVNSLWAPPPPNLKLSDNDDIIFQLIDGDADAWLRDFRLRLFICTGGLTLCVKTMLGDSYVMWTRH